MVLGAGVGFGVTMAAFKYTNGLKGYNIKEDDEDEVARKEEMRKLRRRPLQETLEQLGEGRGMPCHSSPPLSCLSNVIRYLRSRLRGEEARAVTGQVWHRCEGGARAIPTEKCGFNSQPLSSNHLYIYSVNPATKAYFRSLFSLAP